MFSDGTRDVHLEEDLGRPDDLGEAEGRKGHQQSVEDLDRLAPLAQRAVRYCLKPGSVWTSTL